MPRACLIGIYTTFAPEVLGRLAGGENHRWQSQHGGQPWKGDRLFFAALIVVSAIQSSGQGNVRQENGKSSIFLSYISLSAGRNDDQGQLSPNIRKQIEHLPAEQIEELGKALLDFQSKHDLTLWLRQHAPAH